MAATAGNLSPRYLSGDNLNSPKSRRPPRGVSSPWTQIVRGGESESVAGGPSSPTSPTVDAVHQDQITPSPDCFPAKASCSSDSPEDFLAENQPEKSEIGDGNCNAGKKPAWNKPSNGAVEVGPVMGADSWPALSEAARVSAKSPSSDSSKAPGSPVLASQGTGVASSSPPPQKQVANNASPNSAPNNSYSARQRSSKHGGGSSSANNGPSRAPATHGAGVETPHSNPSPRDHAHKVINWESGQRGSQSHTTHDQPQQRSSFRRVNGGQHPRGDGSYHHNHGGRRDHDRGNHDWNPHRNYNGRDAHMQQQRVVPRGFVRPPPHTAPFVPPPPVRPFGGPMGFEMATPMVYISHDPFRGVPFIAPIPPPHAMVFPTMDPKHAKIVSQIEYYFSNENLVRDIHLRKYMDDQGWVPIDVVAGFKKVKELTENLQLILDVLRISTIVEVQGDMVRRRNDWMKWIIPSTQFLSDSGSQPLGRPSHDMLASRMQGVALEESINHNSVTSQPNVHSEAAVSRLSSGDLRNQAQTPGTAEMAHGAPRTASDSSMSSGNSNERESR